MPRAAGLIIAIAGLPGSGKSTLARVLADRLPATRASFGDYVRHLADARGLPSDRQSLQQLGDDEVRCGAVRFVSSFFEWVGSWSGSVLVLDGVRHVEVDLALRNWAVATGKDYAALLTVADGALRAKRRTAGDPVALAAIDRHPVESAAAAGLSATADLVVAGDGEADLAMEAVLSVLRGFGWQVGPRGFGGGDERPGRVQ